ncbi:hypothetical protein [Nocardia implantans]|uniref:hypothetical protein n=1 Tax=Nocardia TaxID=1817 RepID=UPI00189375EB|nr:hypothetical protein [Nocardia sp. CDC192]MBF6195940.1 hypothetical protein [Nocardia beijingensis]MEA3532325.1 hypothetical protein [Nocardia sp. CDC192]
MSLRRSPRPPPGRAPDPDAAPLAVPAVVVASIMLIGMLVALVVLLPAWARDYGATLVYFAVLIYAGLALRLLWWGVTTLRARVAQTDE